MVAVTWALEADFNKDGAYEEVLTGRLTPGMTSPQIRRGLSRGGMYQTSEISFGLLNNDNRYTQDNPSSPLAGPIEQGVPVRVRATHNAITYDRWTGFLQKPRWTWSRSRLPYVTFSARDISEYFGRYDAVNIISSTTRRTDQAIGLVLDAMGVAAGLRTLDVGQHTMPFHFVRSQQAMGAVMDAVYAEMGALLWVTKDGKVRFESRASRMGLTVDHTWGDGTTIKPEEIHYAPDEEDLIATVQLQATIFQADQLQQEVFRFQRGSHNNPADSLVLGPGQIYGEVEFHYDASVLVLADPVASKDYLANAARDGSKTDRTSSLGVTVTDLGGGFTLQLVNNLTSVATTAAEDIDASETAIDVASGSAVEVGEIIVIDSEWILVNAIVANTLTSVTRGVNGTTAATHANGANIYHTIAVTAFRLLATVETFLNDRPIFVASKSIPGQPSDGSFSAQVPFADDTGLLIRDYVMQLLRTHRYPVPPLTLVFSLERNDDTALSLLTAEIGELVKFANSSALIDDWWYIESITDALGVGKITKVEVTLLPSYAYRDLSKIAYDLFTRANAAGDLGTALSGDVWADDAGFDIASNTARPNVATLQIPNVALGAANCVVEASLANMSADADEEVGLIYRHADASNYWRVYLDDGTDEVILEKVVAGVVTELASPAWTPTDTAELRVIAQGSRHRVWVDRKLVIDVTDSALSANPRVGLFSRSTTAVTWDDFYGQGL
ncbi:MAG: hypothetical protein HW375_35 [Anaerolineales bacterium]|nr:hypothetical protein [Anaerolineales bacterium]